LTAEQEESQRLDDKLIAVAVTTIVGWEELIGIAKMFSKIVVAL